MCEVLCVDDIETKAQGAAAEPDVAGNASQRRRTARRVKYVKTAKGTKWFVIYEVINGQEFFSSQEAGEAGRYHSFIPSDAERKAARSLLERLVIADNWKTTLSIDEYACQSLMSLGHFPECIRASVQDVKSLKIDPTNNGHLEMAGRINQHAAEGNRLIDEVYLWFDRHKELLQLLASQQLRPR